MYENLLRATINVSNICSPRSEHSKTPHLLTKNGPRDRINRNNQSLMSLLWAQGRLTPITQHIALREWIIDSIRYPKRNFGENQLLGGSISLSPLLSHILNELHVSNN